MRPEVLVSEPNGRSRLTLGIHIDGGHIKINPTKLHGLAEWREVLQNVHEVRSTLGAFRYNWPFVPGYSDIVRPLSNLTKKDVPFEWTPACTNTIWKLKAIVRTDPILRRPDHDKPFFLEVDASQYALGGVLSQRNERGKLQPVGYFLKMLIPAVLGSSWPSARLVRFASLF